MGNKLQVEIFGSKYTLRGDADEGYVRALASYVDEKMNEIAAHTPDNLLSKLAILTSINITHELFQLRSDQKERTAVIGGKTRDLIESIEEQLRSNQKERAAVIGGKTRDLIEGIEEQFDAFKLEDPSFP